MGVKWMVDCVGTTTISKADMHQAMQDKDVKEMLDKQGGLSQAARQQIESLGYKVADEGGGMTGWHMGVPFDQLSDAVDYLSHMTATFAKAIGWGMLRFALKTWSRECWKS